MFIVSKLIPVFLMPPGCFIVVLLLFLIFVPRKFKYILGIIILFLYLISIQPVSDFLLKPLENAYPPLSQKLDEDPDAIVILGGGSNQNSPDASDGYNSLSASAVNRAAYAFTLRAMYDVPFVFSGGKVFNYYMEPEAVTAGRLLESLGLPKDKIILETQSRNTWENAAETAKLGYKNIILVTSAFHTKRAVYCFEQNGMNVITAPTDYKTDRGVKYDIFSFLPSMRFLTNTHLALHEYIGLLYYIIAYK